MLSEANSLILMLELANGGKSNSVETTGLTESESKTEETAAVTDYLEPRCTLTTNTVVLSQVVPEMDNGMMSNAPNHSMVRRSESLQSRILT
jgi:hypothetical protein